MHNHGGDFPVESLFFIPAVLGLEKLFGLLGVNPNPMGEWMGE